jgi:hypothetical protein
MSEVGAERVRETGAVLVEYIMLLAFITAMVLFLLNVLYPKAGTDFDTLINQWGDKIAGEIAGDPITESNMD